MWWDCPDLQDPRVLQEVRDPLDKEALKAGRDFQDLQDSMESLVYQEIQESRDLQVIQRTPGATWCPRWLQDSMRNLVWLGWCQDQGVNKGHEDFQGHPDHQVHLVVREFQERLGIQDQWASQVIGDQMDLQEKPDLMEKLGLLEQLENQDFQDLWVQEDSQDFQVFQD